MAATISKTSCLCAVLCWCDMKRGKQSINTVCIRIFMTAVVVTIHYTNKWRIFLGQQWFIRFLLMGVFVFSIVKCSTWLLIKTNYSYTIKSTCNCFQCYFLLMIWHLLVGWYVAEIDHFSQDLYFLNICGPVNPARPYTCPSGLIGACKAGIGEEAAYNLGLLNSEPTFNTEDGSITVLYSGK